MGATKKKTWTIHRSIEALNEPSPVPIGWRATAGQAEEIPLPGGVAVHFRQFGELVVADDNSVDVHRSPLLMVFVPHVRRSILWTVGEVRFWATPLRQLFPSLHRLSGAFASWLQQFEGAFCQRPKSTPRVGIPFGGIGSKLRASDFAPPGVRNPELCSLFCGPSGHRSRCKVLRVRGISCEATD